MEIPNLRCYAGEFLGTYLFVLTVCCAVLSGAAQWAASAIAFALMVLVYSFAPISGANLNPAVTLALAATGRLEDGWKMAAGYMVVQVIAGIFAGLSAAAMYGHAFSIGPGVGFIWAQAAVVEIVYTMLLCFVVLSVTTKWAGQEENWAFGLAIGLVIIAGGYPAGAISGGAFNPAIAFGIDVSDAVFNHAWFHFGWSFAYLGFAMVGSGLAVALFMVVGPKDDDSGEGAGLIARLLSEFMAVLLLTLTVGLNVLTNSSAPALSIGAMLACLVYAFGPISGAHINPAVTLAILLCGGDNRGIAGIKEAAFYILAQFLGGAVGGLMYMFTLHGQVFALAPNTHFGWGSAAVAEILFTFILCFVVLTVSAKDSPAGMLGGLAVGVSAMVGGTAVGPISGAALNPAVAFGIDLASMIYLGLSATSIAYTCFQLVGAALAAGLFRVLRSGDKKEERSS